MEHEPQRNGHAGTHSIVSLESQGSRAVHETLCSAWGAILDVRNACVRHVDRPSRSWGWEQGRLLSLVEVMKTEDGKRTRHPGIWAHMEIG